MEFNIVETDDLKIIGVKSVANYNTIHQVTPVLAKQLMPRLKEIENRTDNFVFSLQDYVSFDYKNFNPNQSFEKWIGVEVADLDNVPKDLEILTIHSGKYVVIDFEGSIEEFLGLWKNIHETWLPNSGFELDDRPHFEKLPPSYNPMQKVNKEQIWIPVK